MKTFGIGQAVKQMQNGNAVVRVGWKQEGKSLMIQHPEEGSEMTEPYIYEITLRIDRSVSTEVWIPNYEDILAADWLHFEIGLTGKDA